MRLTFHDASLDSSIIEAVLHCQSIVIYEGNVKVPNSHIILPLLHLITKPYHLPTGKPHTWIHVRAHLIVCYSNHCFYTTWLLLTLIQDETWGHMWWDSSTKHILLKQVWESKYHIDTVCFFWSHLNILSIHFRPSRILVRISLPITMCVLNSKFSLIKFLNIKSC